MDMLSIFQDELAKVGKIFGAQVDPFAASNHPAVDPKMRERAMADYAGAKSKESPSSLGLSLLTGAGLGAIPGGLTGLVAGGLPGAAIGAGIGGGIGALGGATVRAHDIDKIEYAKQLVKDKVERDRAMARMMHEADVDKTRQLSPTRAALISHILSRLDHDRD